MTEKVIETTGKTIDEAIAKACEEFGVTESELDIEILELPNKKFFGLLGEDLAKIRATFKQPNEEISQEQQNPIVKEMDGKVLLDDASTQEMLEFAKNFLQEICGAINLEVAIETKEIDIGYRLNLTGNDLGVLIGRHGQTLDALQYLLRVTLARKNNDYRASFILDVENYRQRREEELIKIAKSVAERVINSRRSVKLAPMNRYERRIIHTFLQENKRVETHSTGNEPQRSIIVTPIKRGNR